MGAGVHGRERGRVGRALLRVYFVGRDRAYAARSAGQFGACTGCAHDVLVACAQTSQCHNPLERMRDRWLGQLHTGDTPQNRTPASVFADDYFIASSEPLKLIVCGLYTMPCHIRTPAKQSVHPQTRWPAFRSAACRLCAAVQATGLATLATKPRLVAGSCSKHPSSMDDKTPRGCDVLFYNYAAQRASNGEQLVLGLYTYLNTRQTLGSPTSVHSDCLPGGGSGRSAACSLRPRWPTPAHAHHP